MMTVYLDYNATAPLLPLVRNKMMEVADLPLNGSSLHSFGQKARTLIQEARRKLGQFVDANHDDIIFTGSGTEANNLALKGGNWDNIFISAIEHVSLQKAHPRVTIIPVNDQGIINLTFLTAQLERHQGSRNLVSVMAANNETGVIEPLGEIIHIARHYGAVVHTDAIQMMGKKPLSFQGLGLDMMTVSAHKLGGPQGIGALIAKANVPLSPLLQGGGQEKGRRAGTENVMAIAGFGATIDHLPNLDHLKEWHQRLEEKLWNHMGNNPGFHIFSADVDRLPNVTMVAMPGVPNSLQAMAFDLAGFAISAGAACSSGTLKPSAVLTQMGFTDTIAQTAIRISSGWDTKASDLEQFGDRWIKIYQDSLAKKRSIAS